MGIKQAFSLCLSLVVQAYVTASYLRRKEHTTTKEDASPADFPAAPATDDRNLQHAIGGIQTLVCFGDSNTDTGNYYSNVLDLTPDASTSTYVGGRHTNGRNFVDFLAEFLGIPYGSASESVNGTNFAWASSTTSNSLIVASSDDVAIPGMDEQVQSFLKKRQAQATPLDQQDSTLFVLWSGYNDYVYHVTRNFYFSATLVDSGHLTHMANLVTNQIFESVVKLVEEGGAKRILVLDLPDLSKFPDAVSGPTALYSGTYAMLTALHNHALGLKMAGYQQELTAIGLDVQIRIYSVNALFAWIMANPTWYGINDIEKACREPTHLEECADPFGHFFLDNHHPTTHVHHLLAQGMMTLLNVWYQA